MSECYNLSGGLRLGSVEPFRLSWAAVVSAPRNCGNESGADVTCIFMYAISAKRGRRHSLPSMNLQELWLRNYGCGIMVAHAQGSVGHFCRSFFYTLVGHSPLAVRMHALWLRCGSSWCQGALHAIKTTCCNRAGDNAAWQSTPVGITGIPLRSHMGNYTPSGIPQQLFNIYAGRIACKTIYIFQCKSNRALTIASIF